MDLKVTLIIIIIISQTQKCFKETCLLFLHWFSYPLQNSVILSLNGRQQVTILLRPKDKFNLTEAGMWTTVM